MRAVLDSAHPQDLTGIQEQPGGSSKMEGVVEEREEESEGGDGGRMAEGEKEEGSVQDAHKSLAVYVSFH